MMDFTLKIYKEYLLALKFQEICFLRFEEYIPMKTKPGSFCLIRHDVDRFPGRALKMAKLENSIGVRSTYYFRKKPWVFKPAIIKEILNLGHEVGYHYENLSDAGGNLELGMNEFKKNLKEFRELAPCKTISMHGRPLNKFDNRLLWNLDNHKFLLEELGVLGEIYLDIDYSEMAYISDTGRNWNSKTANKRDQVDSNVTCDFKNSKELLSYFKNGFKKKICFQVHPERWVDNLFLWCVQYSTDFSANSLKSLLH